MNSAENIGRRAVDDDVAERLFEEREFAKMASLVRLADEQADHEQNAEDA